MAAQLSKQTPHCEEPDILSIMPGSGVFRELMKPLDQLVFSRRAFIGGCLFKKPLTPGLVSMYSVLVVVKCHECGHVRTKCFFRGQNAAMGETQLIADELVIPISVLRDHSKMREVSHRTEMLRVGFQLIESFTHLVNHVIKRGKSEIRELFFA